MIKIEVVNRKPEPTRLRDLKHGQLFYPIGASSGTLFQVAGRNGFTHLGLSKDVIEVYNVTYANYGIMGTEVFVEPVKGTLTVER